MFFICFVIYWTYICSVVAAGLSQVTADIYSITKKKNAIHFQLKTIVGLVDVTLLHKTHSESKWNKFLIVDLERKIENELLIVIW